MSDRVKKAFLYLAIAFMLYTVFAQPIKAADFVIDTVSIGFSAVNSIGVFFDHVLNH